MSGKIVRMRHRKEKGSMRYVQLFHWMLNSEAWKDLRANARVIYLEISKRYNGSNNGFIVYSVREAARDLKVGHATAKRAFDELVSHGFVVAEQRGHFHWKIDTTGTRHRPASEWRLTCYDSDRATKYAEKLSTKEFMKWQKNHSTVPPQTRDVLIAETHGSTTDTMVNKNGPYGACSGNIKGGFGG
jgi:hypothetical protein